MLTSLLQANNADVFITQGYATSSVLRARHQQHETWLN